MKPLQVLPPLSGDPPDIGGTLAEQLGRFAARDFAKIWNSLLARMQFGESEAIKFEAARLLMLYAVGPPPQLGKNAAPGGSLLPEVARAGAIPLNEMTPAELDAVRTLQLGIQRRKGEE